MNEKKYESEYSEKINNVCKYILTKEYGSTLTFEELNKFFNLNLKDEYDNHRLKYLMRKCKNILINYSYILRSVTKVGYYILKPNQISSYTYRTYIIKPLKSFDKAKLILSKTDKKEFNKEEIREHALTSGLNAALIYATDALINDEQYECLMNEVGDEKR